MNGLPLHPAIVHIPLGLAFAMPLIALAIYLAMRRGRLPPQAWFLVIGLQAVLLASGYVALREGEEEEERVEHRVAESLIHDHEEAAERFLVAAGITLALAIAGAAIRNERARRILLPAAVAATFVTLVLGALTGEAGGMIVHGPDGLVEAGPAQPEGGGGD